MDTQIHSWHHNLFFTVGRGAGVGTLRFLRPPRDPLQTAVIQCYPSLRSAPLTAEVQVTEPCPLALLTQLPRSRRDNIPRGEWGTCGRKALRAPGPSSLSVPLLPSPWPRATAPPPQLRGLALPGSYRSCPVRSGFRTCYKGVWVYSDCVRVE